MADIESLTFGDLELALLEIILIKMVDIIVMMIPTVKLVLKRASPYSKMLSQCQNMLRRLHKPVTISFKTFW